VSVPFRIEPLAAEHDRSRFECGEEALDRYFKTQVTQDIRRHITNCFVAVEASTSAIAGFYTLSAASIPVHDLPAEIGRRLPRYPILPAVRIGRLAIGGPFQGRKLGAALLADAAARAIDAAPASFTLLVDAKNDAAVAFYEHHGFVRLESQPRTLFLPLATISKARKAHSPHG
jgi:ribosomal protein S18 acetylase RimI-like enzyme